MGLLSVEQVKSKQKDQNEKRSSKKSGTQQSTKTSGGLGGLSGGIASISGSSDPLIFKAFQTHELTEAYDRRYKEFVKNYGHMPNETTDYTNLDASGDTAKLLDMISYFKNNQVSTTMKSATYKKIYPSQALYHTYFDNQHNADIEENLKRIQGHIVSIRYYNEQVLAEKDPNYWKYNSDYKLKEWRKFTTTYVDDKISKGNPSHFQVITDKRSLESALTFYGTHKSPNRLTGNDKKEWLFIHRHYSELVDSHNKVDAELLKRGDNIKEPLTPSEVSHYMAIVQMITPNLRNIESNYMGMVPNELTIDQLNKDKSSLLILNKYVNSSDFNDKHGSFQVNSEIISRNHQGHDIGTYDQFHYIKLHFNSIKQKIDDRIKILQSAPKTTIKSWGGIGGTIRPMSDKEKHDGGHLTNFKKPNVKGQGEKDLETRASGNVNKGGFTLAGSKETATITNPRRKPAGGVSNTWKSLSADLKVKMTEDLDKNEGDLNALLLRNVSPDFDEYEGELKLYDLMTSQIQSQKDELNKFNPNFINQNNHREYTIYKADTLSKINSLLQKNKEGKEKLEKIFKDFKARNEKTNSERYFNDTGIQDIRLDFGRKKGFGYDILYKNYVKLYHAPSTEKMKQYEDIGDKMNKEKEIITKLNKPYGLLTKEEKDWIDKNVKSGQMTSYLSSFSSSFDYTDFWEYHEYTIHQGNKYKGKIKIDQQEWDQINSNLPTTIQNIESNLVSRSEEVADGVFELKLKSELDTGLINTIKTNTLNKSSIDKLSLRQLERYIKILEGYKILKDNKGKSKRDRTTYLIVAGDLDGANSIENRITLLKNRLKELPINSLEIIKIQGKINSIDKLFKSKNLRTMTTGDLEITKKQLEDLADIFIRYNSIDEKTRKAVSDVDVLKGISELSKKIGHYNTLLDIVNKELASRAIQLRQRNIRLKTDDYGDGDLDYSGGIDFFLKLWQDIDKYAEKSFGIAGASFNVYTNGQYDMMARLMRQASQFIPQGNRDANYFTIEREQAYVDDMVVEFRQVREKREEFLRGVEQLKSERDQLFEWFLANKPGRSGSNREYRNQLALFTQTTGMTFRQYRESLRGREGAFGNTDDQQFGGALGRQTEKLLNIDDQLENMRRNFASGLRNTRDNLRQNFQGSRVQLLQRINEVRTRLSAPNVRGVLAAQLRDELHNLQGELARRGGGGQGNVIRTLNDMGEPEMEEAPAAGLINPYAAIGQDIAYGEFRQRYPLEQIADQGENNEFVPNILIQQIGWAYNKASLVSSGYYGGKMVYKGGKMGLKGIQKMIGSVPFLFFNYPVMTKKYSQESYKIPEARKEEIKEIKHSKIKFSKIEGEKKEAKHINDKMELKRITKERQERPDLKGKSPYERMAKVEKELASRGGGKHNDRTSSYLDKYKTIKENMVFEPKTHSRTFHREQVYSSGLKAELTTKPRFNQIKGDPIAKYEWLLSDEELERIKDKDILLKKKVKRIRDKERLILLNQPIGRGGGCCNNGKESKYKDFVKVNGMF